MSRRLSCAAAVVFCVCGGPIVADAQVEPAQDLSAPAHIAVVEGAVVLERNGVGEPAVENLPLLQGDRLRTESGRVEIILPDGSVLDLDRQTTVDLLAGGLMRLMGGRMIFVLATAPTGEVRRDYQVDAPAGGVRFTSAGEYRVSALASAGLPFLEVSVVRGRAVVDADGKSVPLSAGERAQAAQGQGITATGNFNSALADVFVEWAELQRGQRVGTRSSAYLPPELQVYGGTFDRDGSWDTSANEGPVWYPRVEDDWRPYYDGGWYPYGWGWTWVGGGRWTWATHHYGRWGHGARGWYWRPSAAWGPAWVSWGFSTDFVSWCPLGWNNSPVFGFSFGVSAGHPGPWQGWTVVPHHAFAAGRGYRVRPYAIRGDHLRAVERAGFDVRHGGPPVPGADAGRGTSGASVTPYDRARAVAAQRVSSNPGWGASLASPRTTTGQRTWSTAGAAAAEGRAQSLAGARTGGSESGMRANPTQRTWSADPGSSYGRAQAAAGERSVQADPAGTARSRSYDTRPFASPSQPLPPYPDRFRSTDGAASRPALGSAVPRSAPSRPSESRSPYYHLGPPESRPAQVPPGSTSASSPRFPPERGGAVEPGTSREPRSHASPPSTWPSSPEPPARRGGMAAPRDFRESGSNSSPSRTPGSSPSRTYSTPDRSTAPRSGSMPDRSAAPRSAPSASAPPAESGSRPSSSAPSGMSGGRTPGRAPAGAAGQGAGGRGGSGGGGGGGRAAGGGGRGGRGR